MKTNLIQNYINSRPMASSTVQQEPQKKQVPDFNIQEQLNNRTFIKPLKSKGRLVRNTVFDTPATFVKNSIYNVKSLKHGLDGTANDHELGKMNDLGLKLGGLGIAAYLFTKRPSSHTKAMEFVGLGSFLASMAIWPTLAIQLPARIIHGVNVHQQYEDSFGRKKPFYQDPQFIPWSLYSDKEIDKIGNRLGVPKNIQNRREYIQEKMKKIAVQSNTLWMLTAGFATPVMSALMCNALEKPLLDYQNAQKNKKARNLLVDFNKHVDKAKKEDTINGVNKFIEANKEAQLNDELIDKVSRVLAQGFDPISEKALREDLHTVLMTEDFTFLNTSAKQLSDNIKNTLISEDIIPAEVVDIITPSETEYLDFLKKQRLLGSENNVGKEHEFIVKLFEPIAEKVEQYNKTLPSGAAPVDIDEVRGAVARQKKVFNPFKQVFVQGNKSVLNQDAQSTLKNLANMMTSLRAQTSVLDEYAYMKVAAAPETNVAYNWGKAANSLLETLGISDTELTKAKFDRELMAELIQSKIEKISSDKDLYEKTLKKMAQSISKLDSEITIDQLYSEKVDSVFNEAALELKKKGFKSFARELDGIARDPGTGANVQLPTCLKEIQKEFVNNRLLGVKSSFYRLINSMDMFRRMSTLQGSSVMNDPTIAREVKEEIAELCRHIMLQGHSSDYAIKFYHLRNPNPELKDTSNIVTDAGKLVRKYGIPLEERVDIPQDSSFFYRAMKVMFGESVHPETRAILEANNLDGPLATYRDRMFKEVGGASYFAKPHHKTTDAKEISNKTKFLLTGIAPDELLYKVGKQTYNSKKWLKMFGGIGAGLLAVTVGAQFFFGKMTPPVNRNLQTGNKE